MKRDTSKFKTDEVQLMQAIRSRYDKVVKAADAFDDFLPEDGMLGEANELRQALMQLQAAQTNLCELIAYRKMMGID